MVIYLGADHRGFLLKEYLKSALKDQGYEVYDVGNTQQDPQDDYADFAFLAAAKVSAAPDVSRAILICGSGVGMNIAANKMKNIRATVGISPDHVVVARSHDAINVLCIPSDFVAQDIALAMAQSFLVTHFDREAGHTRRVQKIFSYEDTTVIPPVGDT